MKATTKTIQPWQTMSLAGAALGVALLLSPARAGGLPDTFAPLVEKVKPAVVNISTTATQRPQAGDDEDGGPDVPVLPPGSPFEEFFKGLRPQQGQPQKSTALGSGFIVDPTGYVVTNNHVIENGTDIKVTLADGTILQAKLIGHDDRTDLAVLKVDAPKPLPYVEFGDSDKARVGDWVLAVGNPFGLGGTVTAGIVSARSRNINAGPYDDFLQIDASINKGNSGGPTFDMDGHVIGVNTAILSPSGGSVGIGFAIPANLVKPIIAQLEQHGSVKRGFLGVLIQDLAPDMAEALNLGNKKGALVASVTPDSPAAKVGIKAGDVIVDYAGKPVATLRDLTRAVADTPIGTAATVHLLRGGKQVEVKPVIVELKDEAKIAEATAEGPADENSTSPKLGLKVATLTDKLRAKYQIPKEVNGLLIVGVAPTSPAAERDLKPGDVIEKINDAPVKSAADLTQGVKQASGAGKKAVALLLNRRGDERFIALPITPGKDGNG
jgi:serine protease Do